MENAQHAAACSTAFRPAASRPGYADVLVGLQYGDEGKAKIIDVLAPEYDLIARFNGGANAGHTIDTPDGRIALRQLPSGVFHPHVALYIGSGCALNVWKLADEIRSVESLGVDLSGRLHIHPHAALVQMAHIARDEVDGGFIGTTGNGMGPCYADRALRTHDGLRVNFQIKDLVEATAATVDAMEQGARYHLSTLDAGLRDKLTTRVDDLRAGLPGALEVVAKYVSPNADYLATRVDAGARVLFEGAQSVLLDVVHGEQPYVTASHTIPAYAYVGGDLPPRCHRRTIGVAKAIMSRVGQGPFRSEFGGSLSEDYCRKAALLSYGAARERELFDPEALLRSRDAFDIGVALRMLTGEYGTGTGRPRRVGMFDVAQLKATVRQHAVDCIYINKIDSLALFASSSFEGIPIWTGSGGEQSEEDRLGTRVRDGYAVLPPLSRDDVTMRPDGSVSENVLRLVATLERYLGVSIGGFGLGPERGNTWRLEMDTTC
ncbi:adenylosuccinate synthetase [Pandoraea terrae]|uniref:Adenylosuccinate synthetase n=1 Tax=Pandoraea terrae TaxID=1537710 RepID=A0A5E4YBT3_9BURK|nr:adenylosuccinate synthetase [Pandoraea terrae]VVE45922.1 adenylosuccinate synthetase [Pandoraea terrae]